MKKTMMLLLAAASAAMAVEPVTITEWKGTTASFAPNTFGFGDNSVTVAVELNWDAVINCDVTTCIFALNDASNTKLGMGVEVASNKYIDLWYRDYVDWAYLSTPLTPDITSAAQAVLVYTSQIIAENTYTLDAYLYLYNESGELLNPDSLHFGPKDTKGDIVFGTITGINYNAEMVNDGKIEVYNRFISNKDDAEAVAEHVKLSSSSSNSSIPEPTTATLSLLALAGLAARRRR